MQPMSPLGLGMAQHEPVARIEVLYRKRMARKCQLETFQSPHCPQLTICGDG
jgi:hypothetical protein